MPSLSHTEECMLCLWLLFLPHDTPVISDCIPFPWILAAIAFPAVVLFHCVYQPESDRLQAGSPGRQADSTERYYSLLLEGGGVGWCVVGGVSLTACWLRNLPHAIVPAGRLSVQAVNLPDRPLQVTANA